MSGIWHGAETMHTIGVTETMESNPVDTWGLLYLLSLVLCLISKKKELGGGESCAFQPSRTTNLKFLGEGHPSALEGTNKRQARAQSRRRRRCKEELARRRGLESVGFDGHAARACLSRGVTVTGFSPGLREEGLTKTRCWLIKRCPAERGPRRRK